MGQRLKSRKVPKERRKRVTKRKKEEEKGSKKDSTKRLKEKGGKPRKSNKRTAKNTSGVDQSTLLDFYLADTDDENYQISASEKESEGEVVMRNGHKPFSLC